MKQAYFLNDITSTRIGISRYFGAFFFFPKMNFSKKCVKCGILKEVTRRTITCLNCKKFVCVKCKGGCQEFNFVCLDDDRCMWKHCKDCQIYCDEFMKEAIKCPICDKIVHRSEAFGCGGHFCGENKKKCKKSLACSSKCSYKIKGVWCFKEECNIHRGYRTGTFEVSRGHCVNMLCNTEIYDARRKKKIEEEKQQKIEEKLYKKHLEYLQKMADENPDHFKISENYYYVPNGIVVRMFNV